MATSGEGEIARIYVTGGSANLSALARAIERRARVSVETWSPVEKVSIEAKEVDPQLLATPRRATFGRARPFAP